MSNKKKQMTVGDLREMIAKKFKGINLPSKITVHIIAMCMSVIAWGAIWGPLLIIQLLGLILMIANFFFRKGNFF